MKTILCLHLGAPALPPRPAHAHAPAPAVEVVVVGLHVGLHDGSFLPFWVAFLDARSIVYHTRMNLLPGPAFILHPRPRALRHTLVERNTS